MMAAMLNSDTAILDSDTLLSSLRFTQKHSHSTLTLTQTNLIWLKLYSFSLKLMIAANLNSAMLDSDTAILDSDTLVIFLSDSLKNTLTPFWLWLKLIQSDSNFFHSFWLNLMMVAILNSGHLGLRHCNLGFRHLVIFSQIHSKHTHLTLTLTQTNSIWLKLIHSHLTWWWQPSWHSAILNLAILDSQPS